MIDFQNVKKAYGSHTVLEDVTFHVDPGEFVFLVGRSGAGKTTCMRLLTVQTPFDDGVITVEDLDIKKLNRKQLLDLRRRVGVIYQDYKLLPERTVSENIALGLEITGKSDTEIQKRVADLLELIQLPSVGHVFPSQLSGGEAQRVCIARALATAPRILFADEPTGNLDDATALSIVKLLSKINELGTTVLMATHDTGMVNEFGYRVIEFEAGKLITDKPAKTKKEKKAKKG